MHGLGIVNLFSAVGESFRLIWENGTVQRTGELILRIFTSIFNTIGKIANVYANAWRNHGGDAIIQNLADTFNFLLDIVLSVVRTFEDWASSSSFQTMADSWVRIIHTLSGWLRQIAEVLLNVWENGGRQTFTKLLEFNGKLVEAIAVVLDALKPVFDWVLSVLQPVLEGVISVIGHIIDALSGVLDFIIGVFTGDWERAWDGIKAFFSGIWNAIRGIVTTVWNAIVSIISGVINVIKSIITSILNGIRTLWNNIWNGIKTFASNIWNGILNVIRTVINTISNTISNVINGIRNTITNVFNAVFNTITNIWNRITSTISNTINNIRNIFMNGFNAVKNGITNIMNGIRNTISNIASGFRALLATPINAIISLINGAISGINRLSLDIPDWVPVLGGRTFGINIPTIPMLARGGIVNQPTQAIVGEAGKEAVLPLDRHTEWMDTLADRIADKLAGALSSGDITVILKFAGELAQLARILKPEIDNESARRGTKLVVGGTS